MQPEDQQTNQEQPAEQVPQEQTVQPGTQANVIDPQQNGSQPGGVNKLTDKLKGLMPKFVKILLIILVVIGALFFINLFAPKAIQIIKNNNPLTTPTPEPTPTATPVVNFPPSKYATDPEVIQIEDQLGRLEKGLNEIEFSDDTLHPPLLDWEVSFEK